MRIVRVGLGVMSLSLLLSLSFVSQGCLPLCFVDANCSYGMTCVEGRCVLRSEYECWRDKDCESKPGGPYYCQVDPVSFRRACVLVGSTKSDACLPTCVANADCGGCTEGKTTCLSGTCTNPCGTCSSDGDCSGCTGGSFTCKSGSCTQDEQCPADCQTSADCTKCAGGKTSCIHKKCVKVEQELCPKACKVDEECQACPGKTSCIQGICQARSEEKCPAFCEANVDCAFCEINKNKCVDNKCVNTAICPGRCSENKDCETCDNKRIYCVGGLCRPKILSCRDTCLGNGDCVDCEGGKTTCLNGTCTTPPKVCPATCKSATGCPASACKDRTFCIKGSCQKPQIAGPLQRCGPEVGAVCQNLLECREGVPGSGVKYCMMPCKDSCPKGMGTCRYFGNFKSYCFSGQFVSANDPCDYESKSRPRMTCKPGLECLPFLGQAGVAICVPTTLSKCVSSRCPEGTFCLPHVLDESKGMCVRDCSSGTCPGHLTCTEYSTKFIYANVCFPGWRTGNKQAGERCDTNPKRAERCDTGLACLQVFYQGTIGLCARPCKSDNDCSQARVCLPTNANGTGKMCLDSCRRKSCPDEKYCYPIIRNVDACVPRW